MKKVVSDWSTNVIMTSDEAEQICKLGQGEECCAFLAVGGDGFQCLRMDYPANITIINRLEKSTMVAKGKGGWEGCAWEGQGWGKEKIG